MKASSTLKVRSYRKAQVQSQVFVYILTMIVIGLLLYFGITWIGDLLATGETIGATQFKVNMENAFSNLDYGSQRTEDFSVPEGIKRICFLDNTQPKDIGNSALCLSGSDDYAPLICNLWKDNASAVGFSPAAETQIDIGPVKIGSPYFICFDTENRNRISLRLTGLGDRIKVERAS